MAGDILQYRNARFSGRQNLPDGGRRSWSYSALHHTAVVVGVRGDVVTVLEQNSDGRRYVVTNVYALHEMKQGTIKAYRPQVAAPAPRPPQVKLPKLPKPF